MDNRTTDIPSTQYTFHHTHPAQEARTSSIYYNTPTTNTLHPHRYIQTNQQRERILAFLYVFCTFQFTLVNNIMLFEKSLKNFFSKIDFRGEYCFHNMLYDSIQSKSSHTHPYINTYGNGFCVISFFGIIPPYTPFIRPILSSTGIPLYSKYFSIRSFA